jgi:DegV family protein with EDD domain
MKIITAEREFIDDETLNVSEMVTYLDKYKGKSKSSCPNTADWLAAFDGADDVFCVTITSGLSGSFNSACAAVREYQQAHPKYRACVIDSLSTGPETALIIEKLSEYIEADMSFKDIKSAIKKYKEHTHLIFSLDSLVNLANNGRVSHIVAKFAGVLGIRIIGKASNEGTLEITDKPKGEKKALSTILKNMLAEGYDGGKVRIHHCENEKAAHTLRNMIQDIYPTAKVDVDTTKGLCSFYAERGGLLVGFEGGSKYSSAK